MANEVVLDVAEGIGTFAADVVDLVEDTRFDMQSCSSAGALNCLQRGFMRVEDDTLQSALDVAEQAVFDRMPLRGIGWVVGDAQGQPQARAERHEILLEAQRTGGVGAAGIERQDDLLGVAVAGMTVFLPGQCDGIADEGAGLA